MSQPPLSSDSATNPQCEWCKQDSAPCPPCEYTRIFETPTSETGQDTTSTTPESIAEHSHDLQRFLSDHSTSTATPTQLTKIHALNISASDKENLVTWIENPRTFTPLLHVSQTVFEHAMRLAIEESEQEDRFWMRDVVREMESEYRELFGGAEEEVRERGLAIAAEIHRRRVEEPTARRNAIVQAHLDQWAREHGDGRLRGVVGANGVRRPRGGLADG